MPQKRDSRTRLLLGAGLCAALLSSTVLGQAPGLPGAALAVAQTGEPSEVAALVLALEETTMSSQMPGKILRIHAGLGDRVKAGAPVVEFDCTEQDAQLAAADAEYRGARQTHLSKMRLQALGAAGELEVTLAAAAAEKARSQVDLRRSQLTYCAVHAPFNGQVARLRVKVAESVPLGHPLVDLVNPSTLKAQIFVPGAWIAWLKPRMELTITIRETGRSYRARVAKVNARVEGVSQQLEVEARFEGSVEGLLPGLVGMAKFRDAPPAAQAR